MLERADLIANLLQLGIAATLTGIMLLALWGLVRAGAPGWTLAVLLIAPLVLAYLDVGYREAGYHGFMHASFVYATAAGGLSPENPLPAVTKVQSSPGKFVPETLRGMLAAFSGNGAVDDVDRSVWVIHVAGTFSGDVDLNKSQSSAHAAGCSAVHGKSDPGNETGFFRSEKERRVGDIPSRSHLFAEWHADVTFGRDVLARSS